MLGPTPFVGSPSSFPVDQPFDSSTFDHFAGSKNKFHVAIGEAFVEAIGEISQGPSMGVVMELGGLASLMTKRGFVRVFLSSQTPRSKHILGARSTREKEQHIRTVKSDSNSSVDRNGS